MTTVSDFTGTVIPVEDEKIKTKNKKIKTSENGLDPLYTDTLTIYQRIDRAMADLMEADFTKSKMVWIRPPGTNFKADPGNGYAILPIGDILAEVRRVHGRWGIKPFFGRIVIDERLASDREVHAIGHVDYRLIGRDADDCIEGTLAVEAQDRADKLVNKLLTNAERSLYRSLYSIDGDDAQDPEEVNRPAPETPKRPDPFFDRKPKAEAPKDPAPAGSPAEGWEARSEVALDVTPEKMNEIIIKGARQVDARERMLAVAKAAGLDSKILASAPELDAHPRIRKAIYLACVRDATVADFGGDLHD